VTGGGRKQHEELHNLYHSPERPIIRGDEMRGTCNTHGEIRNTFWLERLKGRNHSEDLGVDST
jgi:hypothetical protein